MFILYHILFFLWAANYALALPLYSQDATLVDKRNGRWGKATWYHPGHGNCGGWNNDNDLIVAISKHLYDNDGASNCGQYVQIIDTENGRSAFGKVVDSCPSCGDSDLDISPGLFSRFDDLGKGVLSVSWHFMSKGWSP